MLKMKILRDLSRVVSELGYKTNNSDSIGADIVCNIPKNPAFGDYSTNLALQLAKLDDSNDKQPASTSDKHFKSKRGENPIEIANEISKKLENIDYLEKVEVAGSGFINFFIKDEVLLKNITQF